jgi:hypothetical protein
MQESIKNWKWYEKPLHIITAKSLELAYKIFNIIYFVIKITFQEH